MKITDSLYIYPEKGMLDCNTYVIKGTSTSILIDPGSPRFLPALMQDLYKDGIMPDDIGMIANTHLHIDHCAANEALKRISAARIAIHPAQKAYYDINVITASEFFGFQPMGFKEDCYLDGSSLDAGDVVYELMHLPGHSPDSICFYSKGDRAMICGDVIFGGNTGSADIPGSDAAELKQSMARMSGLEIEYLLPGHLGILNSSEKVRKRFEFINRRILKL